jgi:hypothetical protein
MIDRVADRAFCPPRALTLWVPHISQSEMWEKLLPDFRECLQQSAVEACHGDSVFPWGVGQETFAVSHISRKTREM